MAKDRKDDKPPEGGKIKREVYDREIERLHTELVKLQQYVKARGLRVVVIEHHQAVMAHADWIIDLGPGAGHDGGRIVFEGTPAELVAARSTLTGEHLAAYVEVTT